MLSLRFANGLQTPLCGQRHGVIRWIVQHRCYLTCRTLLLDLFLLTVARCFPSRVLTTFSLSVLHAGVPTHLNSAIRTVFLLDDASTRGGSVFSDLAWCLAVGGHASTQTCPVEPSCSLSLSCFKHVWHRFLGCLPILTVSCESPRCGLGLLRYRVSWCSFCSFSIFCIDFCTITGIFDNLVDVLHLRESSRGSLLWYHVPLASLAPNVAYRQGRCLPRVALHGCCTARMLRTWLCITSV